MKTLPKFAPIFLACSGFVADILEFWNAAPVLWAPDAIKGVPSQFGFLSDCVLCCLLRLLGVACLIFSTSGVVANFASVYAMEKLYSEHYKMRLFHEGFERGVQEMRPPEDVYGIRSQNFESRA
eukprot:TRINITY_DN11933_c0_g1_i5.p4 TRINITY_DN11933_c0_g1~~TRINITY_DN11933_c0_g1_i5.p4  ORF type:complete len:124 (+),score=11.55 TRINITY_DN11933_c0_g1_i5:1209-1580(+)